MYIKWDYLVYYYLQNRHQVVVSYCSVHAYTVTLCVPTISHFISFTFRIRIFQSSSCQWMVTIQNTIHYAHFECHVMCNWFKMCLPLGITTTKCWIPRHCELPTLMDEGEIILHVGSNFSEYTNRNEETCRRIESFPNRRGPSTAEGQAETNAHFPRTGGKYHFAKWYLVMEEYWWSQFEANRQCRTLFSWCLCDLYIALNCIQVYYITFPALLMNFCSCCV